MSKSRAAIGLETLRNKALSNIDKLVFVLSMPNTDNLILQRFCEWCADKEYGVLSQKYASGKATKQEIAAMKDQFTGTVSATYAVTFQFDKQEEQINKLIELLREEVVLENLKCKK